MRLTVFRRADDAILVIPAMLPYSPALTRLGALREIGSASVELCHLSDALVEEIGRLGYALAKDADAALIRGKAGFAGRQAHRVCAGA